MTTTTYGHDFAYCLKSHGGIKELKNDFSIDDFVTNNFWATEACGNFIVMAYNFMSLSRHALINSRLSRNLVGIGI